MPTKVKPKDAIEEPRSRGGLDIVKFDQLARDLAMHCHEVSYAIGSLPTSRVVSDSGKEALAESIGGQKRGLSASKRLFASDHPLVAEYHAARRQIDQWRDTWTIVKSDEVEDQEGRLRVARGVRLIRNEDIEPFDAGYKLRVDQLYAAVRRIQAHMTAPYRYKGKLWPSILEMDRERLGREFNSGDYPADVTKCVVATEPSYRDYTVSVALPRQIYERQEKRLQEAMSGTIEVAVGTITGELIEVFQTLANQLVNREVVHPREPALRDLEGAEVVRSRKVPGGDLIAVQLRRQVPDPDREGKTRSEYLDLEPMTQNAFQLRYKPMATEQRKRINQSVVDNLVFKLEAFSNVGKVLGEPGEQITEALDRVRNMLASAGSDPGEITEEIRNANSFRRSLSQTLDTVSRDLAETAEEVVKARRVIRSRMIGAT